MTDRANIRIGKMDTLGGVIDEMKRVYREMRRGSLDTMEGKRLADVLTAIRQGMEISEIELRLRDLEGQRR